jgi:hypothetical protein
MANAGWYPDPAGGPGIRYFDGSRWTEHTATRGVPPVTPSKRAGRLLWALMGVAVIVAVGLVASGVVTNPSASPATKARTRAKADCYAQMVAQAQAQGLLPDEQQKIYDRCVNDYDFSLLPPGQRAAIFCSAQVAVAAQTGNLLPSARADAYAKCLIDHPEGR